MLAAVCLCSSSPKHACSRLQFPLTQKMISSCMIDGVRCVGVVVGIAITDLSPVSCIYSTSLAKHVVRRSHGERVSDTSSCIESLITVQAPPQASLGLLCTSSVCARCCVCAKVCMCLCLCVCLCVCVHLCVSE